MAKSRAAPALRRGLLPAMILGAALAGCRFDTGPAAGGPTNAVPAATPAAATPPAQETSEARPVEGPGIDAVPGRAADAPESTHPIVYHVVKGARFFDILVARIGDREYIVLGETDDMCLDLPDQRDFDGDGHRDALVFRSPACRGDTAPGLLFFVSGDTAFRRSNPFPGHRPRVERWNGGWSVLVGETRHVLRDGRAVPVE